MICNTGAAAASAMRRVPHEGHLPHARNASNSSVTNVGNPAPLATRDRPSGQELNFRTVQHIYLCHRRAQGNINTSTELAEHNGLDMRP